MLVADGAAGITLTNRAFAAFTGHERAAAVGRAWPEVLSGDHAESAWKLHRAALNGAPVPQRALVSAEYDGGCHRVVAEARALPDTGPDSRPAGVVVSFREPLRQEETLRVISE